MVGCATVRTTDPPRTATEQFLLSQAIVRAVEQLSAAPLRDQVAFVDATYLENTPAEKAFVVGEVRSFLLNRGVRLTAKREEAKVIIEVRSGGIGIDRYDWLFGIPPVAIPFTSSGGVPVTTPELALFKNQRQRGFASVAFVAYVAATGEIIASSGPGLGRTRRADYWIFGTGPRTVGDIPPAENAP
jgi:hypothetical protein